MSFFSFASLQPDLYVFIVQTKAFGGVDTPGDDDTHGRSIAACWFEQVEIEVDGNIRVRRVDRDSQEMVLSQITIAEMIRAAGLYMPVGTNESAQDVELKLEKAFLDHELALFL